MRYVMGSFSLSVAWGEEKEQELEGHIAPPNKATLYESYKSECDKGAGLESKLARYMLENKM